MTRSLHALAFVFLALFAGCSSQACDGLQGACISIDVSSAVGGVDSLHVDLTGASAYRFESGLPSSRHLPAEVAVLLPATASGQLSVHVAGYKGSAVVASGSGETTLAGGRGAVRVHLVAAQASCTDQVDDGNETDVDCGGPCPPCAGGRACSVGQDCTSSVCLAGVCQAAEPTCADGVKNQNETGIDCGGTCPGCADGGPCVTAADCLSGGCSSSGACLSSAGVPCTVAAQCGSNECTSGECVAVPLLTAATPALIPSTQMTSVQLRGANLVGGALFGVTLDGVSATAKLVSSTEITVTAPVEYGKHGPVEIVVTNGNGATSSSTSILRHYLGLTSFAGGETDSTIANAQFRVIDRFYLADMNNDGHPDLVNSQNVANGSTRAAVTFVRPWSEGEFVSDERIGHASQRTQCVGDFDEDGNLDLLADVIDGGETYFIGGDGMFHFSYLTLPITSTSTANGLCADVNGDKHLDYLLLDSGTTGVVYLGKGDGTFGTAQPVATNSNLAALADLNADGLADIVTVSGTDLSVFIAKGAGAFATPTVYALPQTTTLPPMVFDFNGDGALDIVASIGTSSGYVLRNNKTAMGAFTAVGSVTLAASEVVIGGGDVDLDGHADLLVSGPSGIAMLAGNGTGAFGARTVLSTFSTTVLSPGLPTNRVLSQAIVTDVDGDGQEDVITSSELGVATLYRPTTGVTTSPFLPYNVNSNAATAVDVNGDGFADIVVGDTSGNLQVGLGSNARVLTTIPGAALAGTASVIRGGLIDADANIDLLVGETNGSIQTAVGQGNGMFTLSPPTETGGSATITNLELADLNGDGHLDAVVSGDTAPAYVLLGDGQGAFSVKSNYPKLLGCKIGRFDADEIPDIVCQSTMSVVLLPGVGDGTFGAPGDAVANAAARITSADFDADGFTDVQTGAALYLSTHDGHFMTTALLSGLSGGAVADLDLDGRPEESRNTDGCNFGFLSPVVRITTLQGASYGCSGADPVFGDFDGDGLIDIARSGSDRVYVLWNRSY